MTWAGGSSAASRRRATRLLLRVIPYDEQIGSVAYWNAITSGDDARAALSLACGYPADLIDPVTGVHR